jgi:hypothetical protein
MKTKTMNVWHFSNGKLTYDRNDEIVNGLSLACGPGEIGLCDYGFHGSANIIDALGLGNGSVLSFCEIGGKIIEGQDKVVASIRRHIVVVDIERTLHEFAIWCAEQALSLIEKPDSRSLEAIVVKRRWLDGLATDKELDAARAAARAAEDAAWVAARDAARDAGAAGAAQNQQLTNMVMSLPEFEDVEI